MTVSQPWDHLESCVWSTLQKICNLMVMSSVLNANVAVIQNVAIVMYHCELLSIHHMKGIFSSSCLWVTCSLPSVAYDDLVILA